MILLKRVKTETGITISCEDTQTEFLIIFYVSCSV